MLKLPLDKVTFKLEYTQGQISKEIVLKSKPSKPLKLDSLLKVTVLDHAKQEEVKK